VGTIHYQSKTINAGIADTAETLDLALQSGQALNRSSAAALFEHRANARVRRNAVGYQHR